MGGRQETCLHAPERGHMVPSTLRPPALGHSRHVVQAGVWCSVTAGPAAWGSLHSGTFVVVLSLNRASSFAAPGPCR